MDLMDTIGEFMTPLPVWDRHGEILLPLFGTGHLAWLAACLCMGIAITLILYFAGSIGGILIVNKTQSPVIGFLGFSLLARYSTKRRPIN